MSDNETLNDNAGLSRKQKLLKEQRDNDMLKALDHPATRRMLLRLIEDVGYFRTSFTAAGPDTTAFNEGVRSVGVRIVDEIEAIRPGSFAVMQGEAIAQRTRQNTTGG